MDIQSNDENKGQLYLTTLDILRGEPPQINLGGVTADILARQERDRLGLFLV